MSPVKNLRSTVAGNTQRPWPARRLRFSPFRCPIGLHGWSLDGARLSLAVDGAVRVYSLDTLVLLSEVPVEFAPRTYALLTSLDDELAVLYVARISPEDEATLGVRCIRLPR